jgi:ATP-dependent DNA helicase RecG
LGISVPRNENLANVFYRLRLIEAYGTGIPKIMRSYDGYMRKPELQATGNAFKITLPNRNINSRKETGNKVSFTENEEKVIALLDKQNEIVRKDVEANLAVSQAMAVRLLRGLIDKGVIRSIGGGKKTRYVKFNLLK